jgi:hypothetical protein
MKLTCRKKKQRNQQSRYLPQDCNGVALSVSRPRANWYSKGGGAAAAAAAATAARAAAAVSAATKSILATAIECGDGVGGT